MAIKVAFIGAGSIGFTRTLFRDLLSVAEFRDTTFSFTDINQRNLDMVTFICEKDIKANNFPARIVSTTNRRKALEGADYVINCTRIGGLEGFQLDIDIPLKYGVDQCVGDTLCIGGIMYGQRNIPCILDFCRDIREVARPGALFINYANPMAMNTWAALKYGGVNCIGLCHGVEGGWWQISQALGRFHGDIKKEPEGDQPKMAKRNTEIICAGINHQTWYVQVLYKGRKVSSEELLAAFEASPDMVKSEKVRLDILRRFGYYSTESNGHLSEYVAWYRKRPSEIMKWIDLSSWINGETGGYLRCCLEGRNWFVTDFPRLRKEAGQQIDSARRSSEHGSWIIEGRETGRIYRGHFNVRNNGIISNLPDDAVVEVPGYVDRNGINIPMVGELPLGCAAICNTSISVQRLAVEAAVHGDDNLLRQAAMMDPLTGAVCDPPEIAQMVDEMLVAQAQWLPQYKAAIRAAKKRLASGHLIKTRRGNKGAARIKPKLK